MYVQFYRGQPLLDLPLLGLCLFLFGFALALARALFPGPRTQLDEVAQLPLQDHAPGDSHSTEVTQ
jgi:hypothetical protein